MTNDQKVRQTVDSKNQSIQSQATKHLLAVHNIQRRIISLSNKHYYIIVKRNTCLAIYRIALVLPVRQITYRPFNIDIRFHRIQ